jgi:hypothetical protein
VAVNATEHSIAGEEWRGSHQEAPEEWAQEIAGYCLEETDEKDFTAGDVELLTRTLLECVRRHPGMYPGFEVLLYLPNPT